MATQNLRLERASSAEAEGALSLDALSRLSEGLGLDAWRRCSDVAQVVASYLVCHPRVSAVRYPGLRSDALYQQASCVLRCGFGPRLAFALSGGEGWWVLDCAEEPDARDLVMRLERWLAS